MYQIFFLLTTIMQSNTQSENPIETYVFLDVETTGLPSTNYGETKITEISLLSVLRRHFDESPANVVPRVLNKLTMCFHPAKFISPAAQNITGLSNELLEQQGTFNKNFCDILHNFVLRHPQPICILAHNGNRFDFPLLQAHTKILGMPLPEGILCADTLLAFRELKVVEQPPPRHIPHGILEPYTPLEIIPGSWDNEFSSDILKFLDEIEQSVHEKYGHMETKEAINSMYGKTPKRSSVSAPKNSPRPKSPPPHESLTSERMRRRLDFDSESPKKCKPSYSLDAVHQHFFGKRIEGAHSAEGDTMALLRCITAIGAPFHNWVQKNHRKLNSILKMW